MQKRINESSGKLISFEDTEQPSKQNDINKAKFININDDSELT